MKNAHIIKLGGMLAIVCFLFMPVAGCGSVTISGIDLIQMKDISVSVKLFAILAMICAICIIFLQDKTLAFFSAIGGFASLIIAFLIIKGKMSSGSDFGASNAIEFKSGSYLSLLGFGISAIVSKVENEILNKPTVNSSITSSIDSKFCSSCGKKVEDKSAKFCDKCGAKF